MRKLATTIIAILAVGLVGASCAAGQPKKTRTHIARTVGRIAPAHMYVGWGEHTVGSRVAEIGPRARQNWRPAFAKAAIAYPARRVVLAAFKRERRVDVYAGMSPYDMSFIRTIPMTAASGTPGPKLREGDRQVPEGIYSIDELNPNSAYHVAMHLTYPNYYDVAMARMDGRRDLGGGIMIHGSDRSIGCIAVGDVAAEDLFVLASDVGLENVTVVISPRDFRRTGEIEVAAGQPRWVRDLYAEIDRRLRSLPPPQPLVSVEPPLRSGRMAR